jgi:hypothetical protein
VVQEVPEVYFKVVKAGSAVALARGPVIVEAVEVEVVEDIQVVVAVEGPLVQAGLVAEVARM